MVPRSIPMIGSVIFKVGGYGFNGEDDANA